MPCQCEGERENMVKVECHKCCGKGIILGYGHVKGGVCFSCNGNGYKYKKSKPSPTKMFSFSFLWTDPVHVNYKNGEYCKCFNRRARNEKQATSIAEAAMAKNGSSEYLIEEVPSASLPTMIGN